MVKDEQPKRAKLNGLVHVEVGTPTCLTQEETYMYERECKKKV